MWMRSLRISRAGSWFHPRNSSNGMVRFSGGARGGYAAPSWFVSARPVAEQRTQPLKSTRAVRQDRDAAGWVQTPIWTPAISPRVLAREIGHRAVFVGLRELHRGSDCAGGCESGRSPRSTANGPRAILPRCGVVPGNEHRLPRKQHGQLGADGHNRSRSTRIWLAGLHIGGRGSSVPTSGQTAAPDGQRQPTPAVA